MVAITSLPTRLLSQIAQFSLADGQARLSRAQTEAATGRHADMGLALGAQISSTISLRLELDAIENDKERAEQAALRAGVTQASLSALSDVAARFQSSLTGLRGAENGKILAVESARSSIDSMQHTLSTTYGGQYIFGGLMTEQAPLVPYRSGPQQTVISAFEAAFGFQPTDPAAASLSVDDIEGFLDSSFASLFSDGGWTSTWSSASDEGQLFRLSSGGQIDLQANANQPFARTMAQAFSMIETLSQGPISSNVFQAMTDRALSLVSRAQLQIGEEQARIGIGQNRLQLATEKLDVTQIRYNSAIQSLEGVDPYEAATRVNLLMNQLETSYALTGRINRMSLLSYI
jgi:flagellar hook-associated protein 3 FlgL